MISDSTARKGIIAAGRRLAERGMIAGTDGNISVRLETNRVLVTPSGRNKELLEADDLVVVDMMGNKVEGELAASSELEMHLFVYRARSEVTACVHAHPPFATAHAVAGVELPYDVLPEAVVAGGPIALTEFAPPGTSAVARSLEAFVCGHNAFLLRNHGLLTVGRDLEEAYNRHETVEHCAKILHLARQLGGITHLPEAEVERLNKLRNEAGDDPDQSRDR